ncbi:MAG: V-type H+-transporting ATPase subunit C [Streblomastix strix]|uniref:V-type proton ATPase subunit C n=1 Tax=Streblomastix strix TaxID=222440 RepID=A0A5J4V3S6_9EUKA|nr:MAG: V-type H+-transporting ATPase subunit C [Streblomastix strix]
MEPYFIVSLPGDPQPEDTLAKLKLKLKDIEPAIELRIPQLKVGTLDNLLAVADTTEKSDLFIQQVCYRIEKQIYEFQKDEQIPIVDGKKPQDTILQFEWDSSKFNPKNMTLPAIADSITQEASRIDNQMKERAQEYNHTKTQLASMSRKSTGSINVRPLSELVTEKDFIESEKMTTLFIAVPRTNRKEWEKTYEGLTEYVVPRSSRKLAEDDQSILYSVVLFKSVVDTYKSKVREMRYMVREFSHTAEQSVEHTEEERARLEQLSNDQLREYVHWCLASYFQILLLWTHLKIVRVFVESVLRFGLPVNFQAVIIAPNKKNTKKIIDLLNIEYKNLAFTSLTAAAQLQGKDGGAQSASEEKKKKKEAEKAQQAAIAAAGGDKNVIPEDDPSLYPFVFISVPLLVRMAQDNK